MLTIFVSCTLVAIHSTSESSGDWDVVDQGISDFTKVAMPWCLLAMGPARAKPGIFRLTVVSQWVS